MNVFLFLSIIFDFCAEFVQILSNFCTFVINNTSHASHQNSAPGLVFDFFRGTLNFKIHEVH